MALVLDLTGPSAVYATRLLVEAGHDVIRVESPRGDALRREGPFLGGKEDLEHGAFHQFMNAGKRSLALDLQNPAGHEIFLKLVERADVVVANLPLPVEEEILLEKRSGLVLVKVEEAGPELCAFARSGLLSLTGYPDKTPFLLGGGVIHAAAGLYVAAATALSMLKQQLTGRGEVATVSVMQCLETLMEHMMVIYTFTGKVSERQGARGAHPISGAYACKDGYFMLRCPPTEERWAEFMEWVQDPVLTSDPSLRSQADREARADFVEKRLEAWSRGLTKAEIVSTAPKYHVAASPISTPLNLTEDPQLLARGFLKEMQHPEWGRMLFPQGAIATLLGSSIAPAPSLGQHNQEILRELGEPADLAAGGDTAP